MRTNQPNSNGITCNGEPRQLPVRVLHVVGRMDRGGIETMIMNLYRSIDRTKVQFDFLTHYGREAVYNEEIRALGGRIFDMPKMKDGDRVYYENLFKYRKALKSFFQQHQEYVAIHGHLSQLAAVYMPIAKKYGNVRCCIAHSHNTESKKGLVALAATALHFPLRWIATDFFACSMSAARWILPNKQKWFSRVTLIRNAIDVDCFKYSPDKRIEMRQRLNLGTDTAIGLVARFEDVKNHIFLLRLFSEYLNSDPQARLVLVGDGPLLKNCNAYAEQLGITSRVLFLGLRSDVADILQAIDVVVMPSKYEGLPVSLIEAQAAGLPCVLSNGISSEVDVTGRCLFLSLDDSYASWCDAITRQSQLPRIDTSQVVIKAGYDVHESARWLASFYLSKAMEDN